jgi:iron complex outermembrane receptor protein
MKSLDTGYRPFINLLLAAGLLTPIMTLAAEQADIPFDIPAQSLTGALIRFSATTGLQVLYEGDIASQIKSPELKGHFTSEDALQKLLLGSGLNYRFSNSKTITLEKSATPAASQINQVGPTTLPKVNVVGNAVYDVTDPYNENYVIPNATAGTKTDTPIMETPLNVQVVSKQVMKDQQVITLADSLKNVSGVVVNSQGSTGDPTVMGGTQSDITLRGFVSSTFFRNGFRLQQGSRAMANVESVEVLKGPAAILYGLVEPGGMVNVTTKQPQATPYYAFNQQFGTYDTYRTTVDATGPVAGNQDVLYRMNMSYQNSGSWQDFVGTEDLFLAPVLKWNISPKTQATFEFEYNRQHLGVGSATNPYIGGQLFKVPISTNYAEYSPVNTETFFGSMNWSHQFNDDWTIKNRFSANQQSDNAPHYTVPVYTISSDAYPLLSGTPTAPYTGYAIIRENTSYATQYNTYSTNLDLTGHFDTFGLKHTLLLGGDYYRINRDNIASNKNCTTCPLGSFSIIDPYNPVHPGTIVDIPNGGTFGSHPQTDQYGLYGQDQIKLPFNVHVTGGIRYQYLHQYSKSTSAYGNTPLPGTVTTTAMSQDAVTPRVGILWHPQNWVSLYANYAESFGANSGLVYNGPGEITPIAPTSATQYEGGIKTEFFDGRLRATLAYYELTKTNIATGDTNLDPTTHLLHDCGTGAGSCSLAIGAVRSRGPELDIQGEILPGWNAIATWANVDIIVAKTNANNDPLGSINVGDRMLNVPRNTASFWSTYELQDTDFKGLKFGGGVTVRDGQLGQGGTDLSGNVLPAIKTPGYATLGLMTAYSRSIGKSKVTLQLNIDNLLDKRYYTATYGSTNDPLGIYMAGATYGAPRTAMGSISIQY